MQQPLDDVDVHLVAVPANCIVAVDVTVAVYEIVHVTFIPLAICDDILKVNDSRLGKQGEQFFRYILISSEMVQVLLPFKKREDFLICPFMLNYLIMSF